MRTPAGPVSVRGAAFVLVVVRVAEPVVRLTLLMVEVRVGLLGWEVAVLLAPPPLVVRVVMVVRVGVGVVVIGPTAGTARPLRPPEPTTVCVALRGPDGRGEPAGPGLER